MFGGFFTDTFCNSVAVSRSDPLASLAMAATASLRSASASVPMFTSCSPRVLG